MTSTVTVEEVPDRYLLTTDQAAEYLSISPVTLRTWRCRGGGPAFVKISARSVRYRIADLQAWADGLLVGGAR